MDLFVIDTDGSTSNAGEKLTIESSCEESEEDEQESAVEAESGEESDGGDEVEGEVAESEEIEETTDDEEDKAMENVESLEQKIDTCTENPIASKVESELNLDSSDEEETVKISRRLKLFSEEPRKRVAPRTKKNAFDFSDVYITFDMDTFGQSSATSTLQKERENAVDELLASKSIAHQPGFNQMHCLPHSDLSKKKARQLRKIEREKTKGDKWFNMPATEVTEEVKRDLEVLQMRSVLDPKTFYKKNDLKVLPKFFQIGRIVDNAADFYHSRVPKKERKRTMVDELLADAEFQHRSKQKYKEIVAEKQQYNSRAHKHAKRLKKKK